MGQRGKVGERFRSGGSGGDVSGTRQGCGGKQSLASRDRRQPSTLGPTFNVRVGLVHLLCGAGRRVVLVSGSRLEPAAQRKQRVWPVHDATVRSPNGCASDVAKRGDARRTRYRERQMARSERSVRSQRLTVGNPGGALQAGQGADKGGGKRSNDRRVGRLAAGHLGGYFVTFRFGGSVWDLSAAGCGDNFSRPLSTSQTSDTTTYIPKRQDMRQNSLEHQNSRATRISRRHGFAEAAPPTHHP